MYFPLHVVLLFPVEKGGGKRENKKEAFIDYEHLLIVHMTMFFPLQDQQTPQYQSAFSFYNKIPEKVSLYKKRGLYSS